MGITETQRNEENEMPDFIDAVITVVGAAMLATGYVIFTIVAFSF